MTARDRSRTISARMPPARTAVARSARLAAGGLVSFFALLLPHVVSRGGEVAFDGVWDAAFVDGLSAFEARPERDVEGVRCGTFSPPGSARMAFSPSSRSLLLWLSGSSISPRRPSPWPPRRRTPNRHGSDARRSRHRRYNSY